MARSRNNVFLLALVLLVSQSFARAGDLIESYATTYFAPVSVPTVGIWRMRTPEGGIRQFESARGGWSRMTSADGWEAVVEGAKGWVMTPPGTRPQLKIAYERGLPVAVTVDGKSQALPADATVAYTNSPAVWVQWPSRWAGDVNSGFAKTMWRADGRLQLWFPSGQNRAGAFSAMVFVVGLALMLRRRRKLLMLTGGILAALGLIGVFLSQSRGAMVALLFAAVLVGACRLHARGSFTRRRMLLAGIAGIALVVVSAGLFVILSPRDVMSYVRSDTLRWEMLRGLPRMMADAPWGWGAGKCGGAYADWYSTPEEWRYLACLFNDHFSVMADFGWLGGGLYLLAWAVGLFGLLRLAWAGGPLAPLGVWCVLAVAGSFNPILFARTMLYLPLASLVPLAFDKRWRHWAFWVKPLIGGVVSVAAILLAVAIVGGRLAYAPAVRHQRSATLVNGEAPQIWLVADDDVLGSAFMPKEEIRWFYWAYPKAPAIGIVRDLDDLGRTGVRRLVLSGRHCGEYLRRFRDQVPGLAVPPEIVLLSPGFTAPEIPPRLHERARVSVVMGEFAARYDPVFGSDPLVTTVMVKGAELYLQGWMRYLVPTDGAGAGR